MDEEFNNFLLKVNEIGSIVKGLNSKDETKANEAARLADVYLGRAKTINGEDINIDETFLKVKTDKTIINKKAFNSLNETSDPNQMSQEQFMKSMEKDAKKRSEDRRQRKQVADSYKTKAIKAFRDKEYEKALNLYNKAIVEVKDSCVLYTSRALTCLHLGLYERVITDCDHALKFNENSIKAWLYKAKAHLQLAQEDESEKCVKEAIDRHSNLIDFIHDYMAKQGP